MFVDSNKENTLTSKDIFKKWNLNDRYSYAQHNEKVAEITMDDGKANVLSHSMFDN